MVRDYIVTPDATIDFGLAKLRHAVERYWF